MNPFQLKFTEKDSVNEQKNELNKIDYNDSPSLNERDQTNYDLRNQIRATYKKREVIPLVTKFNPDKDFVSTKFNKNELAIVPQDVSDPVFETTNASPEDLRLVKFAKDVYSENENRSDLNGYNYSQEFSAKKYATYIGDDDIVFSIKGTTTETPLEAAANLAKNTAIALNVPTVPGSDKSYFQQLAAGASTGILPGVVGGALLAAGALASTPALIAAGAISATSLIGTGLLYNDLNTFQNEIDKIKQTYPDKKINITGHSQGGTYANLLGINNKDTQVVTYNAGKGLINIYNDIKCEYEDCSNIKNYRIVGDFASMLPSQFQVGESFQLKPKIPDSQTQLEAKSAESLFIPSDLYIPHNIRNFEDRELKNLMPDYGLFGRTLARRTGAATGLALSVAIPQLAPKAFTGVKNILGYGPPNRSRVLTQEFRNLSRNVSSRIPRQNLLDIEREISGVNLTDQALLLQQNVESTIGRQLQQTSSSIQAVENIANNANEAFSSTNKALGLVAGGGIGDITLGLTYDSWFKPEESELESF